MNLKEGIDFYWVEKHGVKYRVFTESFLLKKGLCCGNYCKHCPYKKPKKISGQKNN